MNLIMRFTAAQFLRLILCCYLFMSVVSATADPLATEPKSVRVIPQCMKRESALHLSFLDVGQGSATLIRCPSSSHQTLIDAGDTNSHYPGAEELFHRALYKRLGTDRVIENAILTHPHPDHTYGFYTLLQEVKAGRLKIGTFFETGARFQEWATDQKLRSLLTDTQTPTVNVIEKNLKEIFLCPELTEPLRLIYPRGAAAKALHCPENHNDCSIVTHLNYGGIQILLMADATTTWEKLALKQAELPFPAPVHILSVGHHGGMSSSAEFIAKTAPLLSVLSSGHHLTGTTALRGYPKAAALKNLAQNAKIREFSRILPHYELASCDVSSDNGRCRWTDSVVPSTVLATAVLGSIDMYVRPAELCIESEHLRVALQFHF